MREMGHYIKKLEDTLGDSRLGWEKQLKKEHHIISPIYLYGWIALLTGDWILAYFLPAR
jgi:hypothetical protein